MYGAEEEKEFYASTPNTICEEDIKDVDAYKKVYSYLRIDRSSTRLATLKMVFDVHGTGAAALTGQ